VQNELIKNIDLALSSLEMNLIKEVNKRKRVISHLPHSQKLSAINLVKYLTLRNVDLKGLQNNLHEMGLSSLASSEGHIHRQLQAIRERLGKNYKEQELDPCDVLWSTETMKNKTRSLFGEKETEDQPYIMVTFDASFVNDYPFIKNLLMNGMNVARINCAHDDESVWESLIQLIKKACAKTGKSCRIYMDLAGPKIRTNIINKGQKKGRVKVKEGDVIWLSESNEGFAKKDIVISPNETGILSKLKKGDRVFIDDGVIKGIAEFIKGDKVGIRLMRISSEKKQIKAEKGINFPDTELDVSPLTEFDKACIPFICENADIVGYSFVRNPSDIVFLDSIIKQTGKKHPLYVFKIETPQAVKNLPDILFEGMKHEIFGIMIARGDLAVEIGFERMGEIQEEILWICEAAHVPVIWATQVLENLNKSGLATRSEITDAGHAAQAECIMINKGPHTIKVLSTLKNILKRTAEHKVKKRFTFRPLNIARNFIQGKNNFE